MKINLTPPDATNHKCMSYVDGDHIVYRCALCPDYERRLNKYTGHRVWTKGIKHNINHFGVHIEQDDVNNNKGET
jgi:hypothetical protein